METHNFLVFSLLLGFATIVTCRELQKTNPLPEFTSVEAKRAIVTVAYVAPEKPFALWFLDGLPIPEGRVDFSVHNRFAVQGGQTILSLARGRRSRLAVCLQNWVGETCLFLSSLPANVDVQEDLNFPWPLFTPAPLARYRKDRKLKIHAPVIPIRHDYSYSARLLSKNPYQEHGRLVTAVSHGMEGGRDGDIVKVRPVTSGTGWMVEVGTDVAEYEGVLLLNTTYVPQSGLVEACVLIRPVTIYRRDHPAPFDPGFVAGISWPWSWRCRENFDCMVVCYFLSNGDVNVTVTRMAIDSFLLDTELVPPEPFEEVAVTRMLGPHFGYGAVFIHNFEAKRDAGEYKCHYNTERSNVISLMTVE